MNNKGVVRIAAGIMAHNEEKVIGSALDSLLGQELSERFLLEVFVVANACTDSTADIVRKGIASFTNLHLIEVQAKGKSNAVREFKKEIGARNSIAASDEGAFEFLLFMDADIIFVGREVVRKLAEMLEEREDLIAVLPAGIPDTENSAATHFVRGLYEAKAALARAVGGTTFSGQCYMIRGEVARRIEIPEYVMAEDSYIAERLRGGFLRNHDLKYVYPMPPGLRAEIRRIFRHSLTKEQMRSFYRKRMFEAPLIEGTKSVAEDAYDRGAMKRGFRTLSLRQRLCLVIFYVLGEIGNFRARYLIRRHGAENIKFVLDQWKIIR